MQNLAVIFGGTATEHDVSVITGVLIANGLDRQKYNVIPLYIDRDGKWYTGKRLLDIGQYKGGKVKKTVAVSFVLGDGTLYKVKKNKLVKFIKIDVAINCLHGERGEDGSVSGLCRLINVPLASPAVAPSAICMDKSLTKLVLSGMGIKTLPSITLTSVDELEKVDFPFEFPVIVKPSTGGSSIGIKVAINSKELSGAIEFSLKYGERVIIEPFIKKFTEINCACYKNAKGEVVVSDCEQPVFDGGLLSFDDKYKSGKRIFPAKIPKVKSEEIKGITQKVYRELDFSGVIRIDYMIVGGEIYLNEINTVPGSLSYYLFSKTVKGFSFNIDEMIQDALNTFEAQKQKLTAFDSGILSGLSPKGAKRL